MTDRSSAALRAVAFACLVAAAAPAAAHEAPLPAAAAPVPSADAVKARLAVPPADAETWVITSVGGTHGSAKRWTAPDGTRWGRDSLLLRGLFQEVDQQTTLGPDGSPVRIVIRGASTSGDQAETYEASGGRYRYKTPVDEGEGALAPGQYYAPFGGTLDGNLQFFEAVMKAPGRTLALAPSGRVTLEPLATATVSNGKETKTLQAWAVAGLGLSPVPVWSDGDRFFGNVGFLNFLPQGWESVAPELSRVQDAAMAKRAPAIFERFAKTPEGPVAFTGVRLYDADARVFRDAMTVVVRGDRIAAVGPASSVRVPAGARVIPGAGKTLVPGLWDNHQHYGDDSTGPLLLSMGVTSVRDPGNKPEDSIARKKRVDGRLLLGPRIVPVMLIDGPGQYSAQVAVVVKTEAEALAAVERAKAEGFSGIKLYGSLDPKFVAPMAARAKALGLRVQGHVPAAMRPLDAVRAGYDEITHINFVMMQAMPDAVVDASNTLQRFYGPARYAADVDLKSPQMAAYLDELARRGTAVDPTLAIFDAGFCEEPGRISSMYAPYADALPPTVQRGLKTGGFATLPDLPRDRMCAGGRKLGELVVELNRRGTPILAGTDGNGLELIRDVELYVRHGMSPEDALATLTINPARAFGLDKETGSVAVGKKAELALIDGDPRADIGRLRHVEWVMREGWLMNAADLRAAAGLAGGPK